ncbi:MAG: nucleotidyltransferase [Myxococcota bacterium]
MNQDYLDLLRALSEQSVDFVLVGAYALGVHGRPRATGDIDLLVRPSRENATRVMRALVEFGAPLHDLSEEDLATPGIVFQMGLPPRRIDILTQISGVTFDQAWASKVKAPFGDQEIFVIGREALITNKRATGRAKDVVDADDLESLG